MRVGGTEGAAGPDLTADCRLLGSRVTLGEEGRQRKREREEGKEGREGGNTGKRGIDRDSFNIRAFRIVRSLLEKVCDLFSYIL